MNLKHLYLKKTSTVKIGIDPPAKQHKSAVLTEYLNKVNKTYNQYLKVEPEDISELLKYAEYPNYANLHKLYPGIKVKCIDNSRSTFLEVGKEYTIENIFVGFIRDETPRFYLHLLEAPAKGDVNGLAVKRAYKISNFIIVTDENRITIEF